MEIGDGYNEEDGMLGFYASVVYGGGVAGFFTAPKDLLKTKLMVDRHYYNGLFHCIAKIFVT